MPGVRTARSHYSPVGANTQSCLLTAAFSRLCSPLRDGINDSLVSKVYMHHDGIAAHNDALRDKKATQTMLAAIV